MEIAELAVDVDSPKKVAATVVDLNPREHGESDRKPVAEGG
jgi:hypothetical protein